MTSIIQGFSLVSISLPLVVTAPGDIVLNNTTWALIIKKTTGQVTNVTLPAPTPGSVQMVTIKDGKGDADVNTIIVSATPGVTIDGRTSFSLTAPYEGLDLLFNGTEWSII